MLLEGGFRLQGLGLRASATCFFEGLTVGETGILEPHPRKGTVHTSGPGAACFMDLGAPWLCFRVQGSGFRVQGLGFRV